MFRRTGVTTQRLLELFAENECNYAATQRACAKLGIKIGVTTIKGRLSPVIGDNSNTPDPEIVRKRLEFSQRFAAKLEAGGIDPSLINLDRMVIKEWEMGYKDKDDQGQTLPLEGVTFYASPSLIHGPQWTPIHPADGIKVTHLKLPKVERRAGEKVAVFKTDPQIGHMIEFDFDSADPEELRAILTPFHDEAAIDVAKQLLREIRPDRVVFGGDDLDFPEFTRKFRRHPQYARTTQFSVQRAHRYYAEDIEAAGPQAEFDILPGNHDGRIGNDTLDNQIASHGLRPASVPGERPNDTWPNNSVPNLVRLEYLIAQGHTIRYQAPFPSGRVRLNEFIKCQHDYNFKITDQCAHIVHGHDHKLALNWRKSYWHDDEVQFARISGGSLCRNDLMLHDKIRTMPGYVPSGKFEQDWQQGIVVMYYNENGGPNDCDFHLVKISNGVARFNGKLFEARCTVDGRPL